MCSCSVDLQKAENGSDGISWTGPVSMRVDHCLQEPMVKNKIFLLYVYLCHAKDGCYRHETFTNFLLDKTRCYHIHKPT